jgi:hypothetical protein
MRGIVTITNQEGETIIFNSAERTYGGTMEVYEMQPFIGYDLPSTMTFTVSSSESLTFTSSIPGIGAAVSDKTYSHASSATAQSVVFKDHARVVEIIGEGNYTYRLFMIDQDNTLYDTVNITGIATGNASLGLNDDGSVLLNGVVAGAELRINSNSIYSIPSGYDQVQITGGADDIKGYAANGTQIKLTLLSRNNSSWYSGLPAWLQWILRYIFFGWIWMDD